MSKKITTKPNQTLPDVALNAYGTLESAMAIAFQNDVPLNHVPQTQDELLLPDMAQSAPEEVAYLRSNNIEIGTLSHDALACEIVLKPRLKVQPNVTGNPHVLGHYSFDMVADVGFVHTHGLAEQYPGENGVWYISEERHLAGYTSEYAVPIGVTTTSSLSIPYVLPWTVGFGYMMVYTDLSQVKRTVTIKDIAGNEAYCAPVTLLDNLTQDVTEVLIGDLTTEILSATASAVRMRITHVHPASAFPDFSTRTVKWLFDGLRGQPDPDDPENDNKIILELGPGTYTIGVITTYLYTLTAPPHPFPSSSFSMVIKVK